ncbi:MAG: PoNe immunity protein domain-containing protein [Massilia sp.]
MLPILTADEFNVRRRERLLDFALYASEAEDLARRIPRVGRNLADPEWMAEKDLSDAMNMADSRAHNAARFLALSYSAGVEIDQLCAYFPTVVDYWEDYAARARAFDESAEYEGSWVANFALLGSDYAIVNRVVSLGILLGWTQLLPRLATVIDYRNPQMDGLLERLMQAFVPGRPPPPDECTRHLPYFKTLKIFAASEQERPAMLAEYLAEWYEASRRESYYDSHKNNSTFSGYWSWEAAAITLVLQIDDAGYRDATFYPADLVAFAREKVGVTLGRNTNVAGILRARSGDVCPETGLWETLNLPAERKVFQKGEIMSQVTSPYGITVWTFV